LAEERGGGLVQEEDGNCGVGVHADVACCGARGHEADEFEVWDVGSERHCVSYANARVLRDKYVLDVKSCKIDLENSILKK